MFYSVAPELVSRAQIQLRVGLLSLKCTLSCHDVTSCPLQTRCESSGEVCTNPTHHPNTDPSSAICSAVTLQHRHSFKKEERKKLNDSCDMIIFMHLKDLVGVLLSHAGRLDLMLLKHVGGSQNIFLFLFHFTKLCALITPRLLFSLILFISASILTCVPIEASAVFSHLPLCPTNLSVCLFVPLWVFRASLPPRSARLLMRVKGRKV